MTNTSLITQLQQFPDGTKVVLENHYGNFNHVRSISGIMLEKHEKSPGDWGGTLEESPNGVTFILIKPE